MAFPFFFKRGKVPLGDSNLANALEQGILPRFSMIAYPQFRVRRPLRETQTPQIYINPAATIAGLGGVIQGNIIFQPLLPNPNPQQS